MKEIAARSGILYHTLLQTCTGRTSGENVRVVEKVNAFMEAYAAVTDPTSKRAMRPLEEVKK